MKTLAGKLLRRQGWTVAGDYGGVRKSITIFAPHTAHIDFYYGKLGFTIMGVNFKFLSKKELFFFPMNFIMRWLGSIPVRGVKGQNAIFHVAELLEKNEDLHIVVSPEGWITRQTKWNKGFFYMAQKAKVPIVVTTLDYEKKEMAIKKIIHDTSDFNAVISQINAVYKDVKGKNPEQFALHLDS
ncbi:1-acyl-sn-glycerol-3-phosphate acyltransferase [Mangrovibacterium lignilyticum]|uniref:1-acyl-sn-glycerol-3-phosphate acyltransferase n=1 Tax=Mangrovibacterium lignilyticum TaxID=2668052 RepID=UPI0013D499AB|nr:1-acyl-sn-glycerol-3-phosphate acyltransferase [Mangrovibacterium lignilyticum]